MLVGILESSPRAFGAQGKEHPGQGTEGWEGRGKGEEPGYPYSHWTIKRSQSAYNMSLDSGRKHLRHMENMQVIKPPSPGTQGKYANHYTTMPSDGYKFFSLCIQA